MNTDHERASAMKWLPNDVARCPGAAGDAARRMGDGRDGGGDAPEVIRNKEAWQKLRDAKRAAGAAKGSLTKALRKVMKDAGQ